MNHNRLLYERDNFTVNAKMADNDTGNLTGFQARVIEALARIETGQHDTARRVTDLERRFDDASKAAERKYVTKEQGEQFRVDLNKLETVLNKAIWGIFGIVSTVIASIVTALLKYGLPR